MHVALWLFRIQGDQLFSQGESLFIVPGVDRFVGGFSDLIVTGARGLSVRLCGECRRDKRQQSKDVKIGIY